MLIDNNSIDKAFQGLCSEITADYKDSDRLAIACIANGGVAVGRHLLGLLEKSLGREIPCGVLNISFERDDFGNNPIPKDAVITTIPFEVDGARVILVDDVIFSGRTVRAALNELFSLGRPDSVALAVLADRGHRRLPIQADYVGLELETQLSQDVLVQIDIDGSKDNCIKVLD